jgi:signal transduction histidine kinase
MGARFEESESRFPWPEAERWDREGFLAYARLTLAVVCTIIAFVEPKCLGRHVQLSRLLILLYFTCGLFSLIVARLHWHYGRSWVVCLHAMDVVVISLLAMLTGGVQSSFLGLYLFVFLAAACEWGFLGALLTSFACVAFLLSSFALPSAWFRGAPNLFLEGSTFFATLVLSAGLVSSACLLGIIVEREQRRYGDGVVIARLVRRAIPEPSFRVALENALKSVREYFDADQVRLDLQELKGDQAFAWDLTRQTGQSPDGVRSWKLTESVRQASLAMPPEEVRRWFGSGRGGSEGKMPVGRAGNSKRRVQGGLVSGLGRFSAPTKHHDGFGDLRISSEAHSPFVGSWAMLATSFSFEGKWLGRLTVYNPRRVRNARTGLRFLETLVAEVGPAIFNKFLVARLRSRAQARERVRLVQELHDGIVQSLIGLEMQVDHLRRAQTASSDPATLLAELARLQALLHDEIALVREEMQRIRPLQVEPSRFIEYIAGTVNKFQRDQGISATFVAETQEVSLSPRVCTELARIVQESLVNVRKHSGARKVVVSFGRENGHYKLFVEDDGRGFGFTGLLSSAELDSSPKCPSIVRERVRAIGGELMIESTQASGARIAVLVPVTPNGRVSSVS